MSSSKDVSLESGSSSSVDSSKDTSFVSGCCSLADDDDGDGAAVEEAGGCSINVSSEEEDGQSCSGLETEAVESVALPSSPSLQDGQIQTRSLSS